MRTLLTLLGVGLGVAMFVSIRLASTSALASFGDTVDAVAGKANLEVSASSEGVDERVFPAVRKVPGVRAASPVVESYLRARAGGPPLRTSAAPLDDWPETVLLLGLDPLSEGRFDRLRLPPESSRGAALALMADPRAAAVPGGFAARHELRLGDTLTVLASGRPEPLVVRRLLDAPEARTRLRRQRGDRRHRHRAGVLRRFRTDRSHRSRRRSARSRRRSPDACAACCRRTPASTRRAAAPARSRAW